MTHQVAPHGASGLGPHLKQAAGWNTKVFKHHSRHPTERDFVGRNYNKASAGASSSYLPGIIAYLRTLSFGLSDAGPHAQLLASNKDFQKEGTLLFAPEEMTSVDIYDIERPG
jgi:hypothetical protein